MRKLAKIKTAAFLVAALTIGSISLTETVVYAGSATVYSGSGVSVNMRSGAGMDYERVISIPDGATVEIGQLVDGWYEVTYNGYSGYVLADLVNTSSQTSETTLSQEEETDASDEGSATSGDDGSQDSEDEGDIVINGVSYRIDNDFYAEQMPDGFSYTAVLINGEDTNAAYSEELEMYLVRLISPDGAEGWFVHDEKAADYFYPYITVGSDDNYIIIKAVSDEPLEGYSKVTLPIDEFGILTGFQADAGKAEHYIVCAISNSGEEGWYIVDSSTETFITSAGMTAISSDDEEVTQEKEETADTGDLVLFKRLTAALGLISVVLLVLFIAALIKGRNSGDYTFDEDEDEDFGDGDEENISYDDDDYEKYEDDDVNNDEDEDEDAATFNETRRSAYSEIAAVEKPDNIDIIDLN